MTTWWTMLAGWVLLAFMLSEGVREVTPRHLAGAVLVAGAWFALCLAVLG